ncbi:flagellar biosynthesis protein [Luteibacter sp. PPL201]|jgi:flagellar biosynthesis protein|uniref:Flagellar biosynthesis protein n=1 Tax=Luteibacter sahnii TaxID=3021977 RepID=A0ABT6BA82_9GAMM|nr:flagellar biosynthesis protein [Luteibacter sp. PPL193]MDY1546933.1 flagellar biosynthesis protein [Luteibacter sp. PPL193]
MTTSLPSPRRSVRLRLATPTSNGSTQRIDADGVRSMLERAQAMGLAPHLDPQIATLLAAVRLREDVPPELYAALAAVVGTLLAAAND